MAIKGSGKNMARMEQIRSLYATGKCSREIAEILGNTTAKAVQSFAVRNGISHPKRGGAIREWNGSWKGGERITKDGYRELLVLDHPFAKSRKKRGILRREGYVLEHRLVMEHILGRYLLPTEVVHHKDRNKLNNSPDNLELFSSNAEHLHVELSGKCPAWTPQGKESLGRLWASKRVYRKQKSTLRP